MRLHGENLSLSKKVGEKGEVARNDVARIQVLLEGQYRSTLKGAESRLKEQLFTELTESQKQLVRSDVYLPEISLRLP